MKNIVLMLGSVMMISLLSACGKSTATAKLQFVPQSTANTNSKTNALIGDDYPASTFKMKMIAAYLSEDVDPITQNNVGATQMIWVAPECADDLMHCNISTGTAEDGLPWSNIVTTFFDFSNTESAAATLNQQNREVTTGIYRYVRLEFCKTNPDGYDNVQWASDAVGVTDASFKIDHCGVNSKVFDPPLEINAGNSVTVSLNYSLDDVVSEQNWNSNNCVNGYCFELPQFSPSATVK